MAFRRGNRVGVRARVTPLAETSATASASAGGPVRVCVRAEHEYRNSLATLQLQSEQQQPGVAPSLPEFVPFTHFFTVYLTENK